MRGVTLVDYIDENRNVISTHTPHARRDPTKFEIFGYNGNFNSHASCEA